MEPQATTRPTDDAAPQSAARLGGRSLLGLAALIVGAVPFLVLLGLVQARCVPLTGPGTRVPDGPDATVAASPLAVRVLGIASEAGGGALWLGVLHRVLGIGAPGSDRPRVASTSPAARRSSREVPA